MHHKLLATTRRLNGLLLNGYTLNTLPEFTTNQGLKLTFTDSDVPGKVGLVLTAGFEYALLVGTLFNGVLINVIEESSCPKMMALFYTQLNIFIDRVKLKVLPYLLDVKVTAEIHRLANNNMLENAYASIGQIDETYTVVMDDLTYVVECRRNKLGNGVVSGKAGRNYFYVQYSRDLITSFNSSGISRKSVIDNFTHIAKGIK